MRKIFLLVVVLAVLLLGGDDLLSSSGPCVRCLGSCAGNAPARGLRMSREGAQGSVVKLLQSDLNPPRPSYGRWDLRTKDEGGCDTAPGRQWAESRWHCRSTDLACSCGVLRTPGSQPFLQ